MVEHNVTPAAEGSNVRPSTSTCGTTRSLPVGQDVEIDEENNHDKKLKQQTTENDTVSSIIELVHFSLRIVKGSYHFKRSESKLFLRIF